MVIAPHDGAVAMAQVQRPGYEHVPEGGVEIGVGVESRGRPGAQATYTQAMALRPDDLEGLVPRGRSLSDLNPEYEAVPEGFELIWGDPDGGRDPGRRPPPADPGGTSRHVAIVLTVDDDGDVIVEVPGAAMRREAAQDAVWGTDRDGAEGGLAFFTAVGIVIAEKFRGPVKARSRKEAQADFEGSLTQKDLVERVSKLGLKTSETKMSRLLDGSFVRLGWGVVPIRYFLGDEDSTLRAVRGWHEFCASGGDRARTQARVRWPYGEFVVAPCDGVIVARTAENAGLSPTQVVYTLDAGGRSEELTAKARGRAPKAVWVIATNRRNVERGQLLCVISVEAGITPEMARKYFRSFEALADNREQLLTLQSNDPGMDEKALKSKGEGLGLELDLTCIWGLLANGVIDMEDLA